MPERVWYPNGLKWRAIVFTIAASGFAWQLDAKAADDGLPVELQRGLTAHWPLAGDGQDRAGQGHHLDTRGQIDWDVAGPSGQPRHAAGFNGRDAFLEVSAGKAIQLGKNEFSLAAWICLDEQGDDLPGDIASQYDSARRRGFHLTMKSNTGVTTTQANYRNLQFGIDDKHDAAWTDCGRPGNAILAFALASHDGQLFAGTCEPGKDEAGHVYRLVQPRQWLDCGAPAACNSVTALAEYDGQLYAGVGKYRLGGSALKESENPHLGGKVFRFAGESKWVDCGQLPGVEAIGGLVVYRGKLYASSLYRPAGFFRYEGGSQWTALGTPDGKRVEALGIYNGHLYATSYDGGHVYRFDRAEWLDCGQLGDKENTQTYSFAVHEGRLLVGTWRTGRVFRFEDVGRWSDIGRLGQELEVMGMLVHNGRPMAGSLPLAEVYSYEGGTTWRRMAQLDNTPDVMYRRAWTMAEFGGRLYVSTLPSGKIYSFAAGANVSWDRAFPVGWHHIAAIKAANNLKVFVDGKLVSAAKHSFADYDLTSDQPFKLGFGANDHFHGRMHDVRLYGRELNGGEVVQLSKLPR